MCIVKNWIFRWAMWPMGLLFLLKLCYMLVFNYLLANIYCIIAILYEYYNNYISSTVCALVPRCQKDHRLHDSRTRKQSGINRIPNTRWKVGGIKRYLRNESQKYQYMLKFYYYKLCTNIICNIEIKHLLNHFKDQMK